MKSNELMKIREMNDVELNKKLADLKEELFHLRLVLVVFLKNHL